MTRPRSQNRPRPGLRAVWLGACLREQREAARLILSEAGSHIQRDGSTISRMESGLVPPRPHDVTALLNLYEVQDEAIRRGVERLCNDLWRKGWWDSYRSVQDAQAIEVAWLESKVDSIRWFECLRIPAPLQTAEYARARMVAADPNMPASDVEHGVEFTMRRHDHILGGRPPQLSVVMDEALLHRVVGSAGVLREQLIRLLNLSTLPHLELRVLPFTAGGLDLPGSPFTVLALPAPYPFSEVALVDTSAGFVEVGGSACRELAGTHDRLVAIAAGPDDTRTLIQARVDQLS